MRLFLAFIDARRAGMAADVRCHPTGLDDCALRSQVAEQDRQPAALASADFRAGGLPADRAPISARDGFAQGTAADRQAVEVQRIP